MKKKILFVIPSLRSGGAEKSLLTLLTLIDYQKYSVDLLCFRREGLFYDKIPDEVNVITGTEDYEMFDGGAKSAVMYFLKKGRLSSVADRIRYIGAYRESNPDLKVRKMWQLLKKQLPDVNKKYDCVIGYLEGNASFYAADYENTDKRICYVHSDIKKLGINKAANTEAFEKCDVIVTVSQACADSIADEFPFAESKTVVIENITSARLLRKSAQEETVFNKNGDENILLTVGRFSPPKGIDLAVKAAKILKDKDYKFKWYHIGTGELKDEIEALISSLGVENEFILLGERANPYPYIGQCDIYVQPSRYEGKSIAIDEAKCLCRPIVTTNFTTVADQINDGVNGLVCQMNETDIAEKIETLFNDKNLRKELEENLEKEKTGNEEEIEKFYAVLN
ncbi:MAG: glycosyltransferase [Acutalibacteraceae bacterium]|nr:glycosyltransferase [Acutalibacteraceae bacterium]